TESLPWRISLVSTPECAQMIAAGPRPPTPTCCATCHHGQSPPRLPFVRRQGRSGPPRGGVCGPLVLVLPLDRPQLAVPAAQGPGVDPRAGHVELEADFLAQQPAQVRVVLPADRVVQRVAPDVPRLCLGEARDRLPVARQDLRADRPVLPGGGVQEQPWVSDG